MKFFSLFGLEDLRSSSSVWFNDRSIKIRFPKLDFLLFLSQPVGLADTRSVGVEYTISGQYAMSIFASTAILRVRTKSFSKY